MVCSVVVVEVVVGFLSSTTVVQADVARMAVTARARTASLIFIRSRFAAGRCLACMNFRAARFCAFASPKGHGGMAHQVRHGLRWLSAAPRVRRGWNRLAAA